MTETPGGRSSVPVLAACAAVAGAFVYVNALDNPFVYDDFGQILENPSIRNLSDPYSILVRDMMRPAVNFSYALDTAIWGLRPFGYHVTNMLLHVTNILLVFWAALLVSADRGRQDGQRLASTSSATVIAFATAMLFAVHPMMSQAVGYVSGRSEVLYVAFFLLAFFAGRQWMLDSGRRWWLSCVGLWLLSMLTKESAVMLPVVLISYDWLILESDRAGLKRRFVGLYLPMLAIIGLAGASRLAVLLLVEYPSQTAPDWRFAFVAVDAFWRYLSMFALPKGQSIFHAVTLPDSLFALRPLAGVLGLAAYLALVWWLRRVHSLLSFGLLWFLLLLIPSSLFFTLGFGEPMAEHRAYGAAVGLFLAWGCSFEILWNRVVERGFVRVLATGAAVLFLAQLGFKTVVRNAVWDDPVGLSSEAVRYAPEHWMPRMLLAEAYRQAGSCVEAVPEYRAAISLRPEEQFPYTKLAGCRIEAGRFEEAEEALLGLRAVNPLSEDASMGLGVFAVLRRSPDESRHYFLETLERDPGHQQARQLLAFVDGTLSEPERVQVCREMEVITQGTFVFDECVARGDTTRDRAERSER